MADCFNHNCPFRVNNTSSVNQCECVACPNIDSGIFVYTSNRTLTNDELTKLQAEANKDKNYGVGNYC